MANRKIPIILLIIWWWAPTLYAGPMYTDFSTVIKKSKSIFIGTYLDHDGPDVYNAKNYRFKIDELLVGKISNDQLTIHRSENGGFYGAKEKKYIVFVDDKNNFEWIGWFMNDSIISNNSLIFMAGFCDWNAHLVSPAYLTLGQLKDYIKNGNFNGTLFGDLHFFSSETKKMEPSPIHIEVKYNYTDSLTSQVVVNGIDLNDFIKVPDFYLPFYDNEVIIQYERNLYRPLQISGKIVEQPSGANLLETIFRLDSPEEITYEQLQYYLSNAQLGPSFFEVELKTQDDQAYTWVLNSAWGDNILFNYQGKDLKTNGIELAPKRIITFGTPPDQLFLGLDSCKVAKEDMEDASNYLMRELRWGPIQGTLYTDQKGIKKTISRCTLTYITTKFERDSNRK